MEKIKEDLYVKKGRFGYRIVYPIKKDIDKPFTQDNINWKHLLIGDWTRLISTSLILLLIMFGIFSYSYDTEMCRDVLSNPCPYFEDYCKVDIGTGYFLNLTEVLDGSNYTTDDT